MRRATEAERIHNLEREMETRKIFLQAAVDEIEDLKSVSEERKLSKKEIVRGEELLVIARNHTRWIESHKGEIQNFYRPATA
jgi:hypothetical protein